jgi:WD40 repeat protein
MAAHHEKRQKMGGSEESSLVRKAVDAILDVDHHAFKEYVRNMDLKSFKMLSKSLSELSQSMEETYAKFSDIPVSVIASNAFPYLDKRTDWNNFSIATKEIDKTVKNNKDIFPPWPLGCLVRGEDGDESDPSFSPDGECIAFGDQHGRIRLLSGKKGLVSSWQGHEDMCVSTVAFSHDGNRLVSSGSDGTIRMWDLANDNRCLWSQDDAGLSFSQHGEFIVTGGGVSVGVNHLPVCLKRISDGETSRTLTPLLTSYVRSIAFSPNGRTVAIGGWTVEYVGSIELWNLDSDEDDVCISLEGHTSSIWEVVFSPDGKFLASASSDYTIKLWDVSNNSCIRTLSGHTDNVFSISFSPDGHFLASGSEDETIRFWSVTDDTCLDTIETDKQVLVVEFSPDGRMLVTCERDEIHLRSVNNLGDRNKIVA